MAKEGAYYRLYQAQARNPEGEVQGSDEDGE